MRKFEIYLDNPDVRYRVDSLGRRRAVPRKPDDDPIFGPGMKKRFPHPAYALGYAWAVSYEYQMILISLFTRCQWPNCIKELDSGLIYPVDERRIGSYEGMVAFESATAESIRLIRYELVDALRPFAIRHGLDAVPWGLGWLYRSVPRRWTDQSITVKVNLPELTPTRRRTDPRTTPALDALLLYLWLTGGWRDPAAQKILNPAVCFECDVSDSPQCPKLLCFARGQDRPEGLMLRINRTKSALGVHRPPGRPKGAPRWNPEELQFALREYVSYLASRGEIDQHF
jgi:hypothetical protein